MAQKTSNGAGNVMDDSKRIRAEMAKTRAALGRELGALKSRVFGTPASKGAKTMSLSKAKSARAEKTMPQAKKVGRSRTSTKGKVKEVLKQMLEGAAIGAIKGAAEAIAPAKNGTAKKKKPSR